MVKAGTVSEMLAQNVESVASMLLPNGTRKSNEWCAGSVQGEAGASLRVNLTSKAGVWKDFASGEGGDLLDLWMLTRNVSLKEAIQQAKEYLGIRDPEFAGPKKNYEKPSKPDGFMSAANDPYLRNERKLTEETIRAFRVGVRDSVHAFLYFHDGDLIHTKYIARSGEKKKCWSSKNTKPILFGWQTIAENARTIILTEGEIDAMTAFQYGYPALSVPFGGGVKGKHEWIENEYQNLEQFSTIYLAFDMDEVGKQATKDVIDRLGPDRCRVVELPRKDFNECLQAGIGQEQIDLAIQNAKIHSPSDLRDASDFKTEILQVFDPDQQDIGTEAPWPSFAMRIRPSETTVLAGQNGHGKTAVLGHLVVDMLSKGEKICVASMEMPPPRYIAWMVRQACASKDPSLELVEKAVDTMFAGNMKIFDVQGTAKAEEMMKSFVFARRVFGCRIFIVDSLAKCGISEDDYPGQKKFVEALSDFAREHEVHIFLVAHSRKLENELKEPGKHDIKGTGAVTDMVDNVLLVWRNKGKEKIIQDPMSSMEDRKKMLAKPDTKITCVKQRWTGEEFSVGLWFDNLTLQFLPYQQATARRYVELVSDEPEYVEM
jgi:twinkle protein